MYCGKAFLRYLPQPMSKLCKRLSVGEKKKGNRRESNIIVEGLLVKSCFFKRNSGAPKDLFLGDYLEASCKTRKRKMVYHVLLILASKAKANYNRNAASCYGGANDGTRLQRYISL